MKTWPNKVQILSENVDKQSQNTHLEVNIFARQKSKARSRVRIVQNIFALPKLNKTKELALNATEILQLK